jgi:hypothetical protein
MAQPFESIISQNFNGGVVTSVEPVLLKTSELQGGVNIRYSKAGGFSNRPGYELLALAGLSETTGIQGIYATDSEIFFVCNGKIFVTLEDLSNAFEIYSGMNATELVNWLEVNGNLYVFNGIDELKKIDISTITTALTAAVSASVTVSTGAGWKFPVTGTVVVVTSLGADQITNTARTNDVLTITAATVSNNAAIGSKIYAIESIPDALANVRFKAGVEFQGRFLAAIPTGKSGSVFLPNVLLQSRIATATNPDLFHDFVGSGAGATPIGDQGPITGVFKTKSYVVIRKASATFLVTGFDSTTGAPNIEPLTGAYGGAGIFSDTLVGDQLVGFTGREIKQLGEQVGLNNLTPSINPQFDDKIYNFLRDLDVDQSDCIFHFNPAQRLAKLWVNSGGSRVVVVYDDKIDAWAFDFNKPASCVTTYKGETFWGHQTEAKIFQDEISYDDNGQDIDYLATTFSTNAGSPRLSKYFKYLFIKGRLGENTIVTVKIYFDDVLTQQFDLNAADLISATGGTPIGRNRIGGSFLGSSSEGLLAYDFSIEKLLKKRKNVGKMYIEFSCSGQGQVFEISGVQIEGTYSQKFDKSIRK